MKFKYILALSILGYIMLLQGQACSKFDAQSFDMVHSSSISDTSSSTKGECQLVIQSLPNNIWENSVVFDPIAKKIIHNGGHSLGSYAQSAYTYLYNTSNGAVQNSRNHRTGPRQCLQDGTYISSIGQAAYVHGNVAHGSISPGGFKNGYTTIGLADPIGSPWLFDSAKEEWEFARPLGNQFDRTPHAPVTYDPISDAMVSIGENLVLYNSRTNKVVYRTLPAELKNRYYYGIAADPVLGKIVVFGGRSVKLGLLESDYPLKVYNDTWIYDVSQDQWKSVLAAAAPPKGMPGYDFVKFSMAYESVNGTILLRVVPLNQYNSTPANWPNSETWSFNVSTESWSKIDLENAPPSQGQMVFDSAQKKLFIVGGDRVSSARPSLGRQLFACSIPDLKLAQPVASEPSQVSIHTSTDGKVYLSWNNVANIEYRILRAEAKPFKGLSIEIGRIRGSTFVDANPTPGTVYAYSIAAVDSKISSVPVYNQLQRPKGLSASVESNKYVSLNWTASQSSDLVGYHVYRARGAELTSGTSVRLTTQPILQPNFIDQTVDLSNGVAHFYWVKAVNRSVIESGASPWATTMPEAPLTVSAKKINDSQIEVSWKWPANIKVSGFQVYHVDNHLNANDQPSEVIYAWYDSWTPITTTPITDLKAIYTVPAGNTSPHHYFYIRAVNLLGQEGFMTDIVSATDPAFRPHGD